MAERKRRRRRRHRRNNGCIAALVIVVAIGAAAAYGIPWALSQYSGAVRETFSESVEKSVNVIQAKETEFEELTVTEEEVEGHFYYNQLSESDRTVYRELMQGIEQMEEGIRIHAGREDHPEKVYEYLLFDCPEFFWCAGSSQMSVYEDYTEFYPAYSCSPEEKERKRREIDAAARTCIDGIDSAASEYEKIRYVYEYLVDTVEYDEDAPDNQNIYSALVGKRSVCAGYSRAAQYLLNRMGIECIYVIGTAQRQEAHAWNIVNCDGKYYQMDVTFADPVFLSSENGETVPGDMISYDYLCCTDAQIATDHAQSTDVPYPACISDDLNYYKMNGLYYESYDPQLLLNAMNDSIYARREMFVCKFSDSEVYAQAREGLIEELFPKAARTLGAEYGLESVRYTYIEDEPHSKLTVFWDYGDEN